MGQKRLIKSIFNFIIWAMFLIENIRLYKGVFISNEQRAGTGHTLLALKKSFLLLESLLLEGAQNMLSTEERPDSAPQLSSPQFKF